MTTSGTANFNLDLGDLVEEAFERCGQELRSGYDMRTARRSLNLLLVEFANRGINLWTIEQCAVPISLIPGQIAYDLPIDTVDLLTLTVQLQLLKLHRLIYGLHQTKAQPKHLITTLFTGDYAGCKMLEMQ
jgi:hypothetical protein